MRHRRRWTRRSFEFGTLVRGVVSSNRREDVVDDGIAPALAGGVEKHRENTRDRSRDAFERESETWTRKRDEERERRADADARGGASLSRQTTGSSERGDETWTGGGADAGFDDAAPRG